MVQADAQRDSPRFTAPKPTLSLSPAAQHRKARLESGIRIFTILSWVGGSFGLAVFVLALMTGVPMDGPFMTVAGLMAGYVLMPVVLRLTKRLDLINVIGTLWLVVCMGVGAWHYGGFASAALPWLCAIPILSFYYLRGTKLVLVLLALGLCIVLLFYHQLVAPQPQRPLDAVYGVSFSLLLLFLSLASYVFRTAENEAHERVIAVAEEARSAHLKAEVANSAKSKFLASVSHELRTPLNAIVGFSDFMRQRTAASEAKIAEYAADIHYSATHLLALINDVLDYSEVDAERSHIAQSYVDLRTVMDEAMMLVAFQPGAGDVAIERNIAADLPRLMGDARRIKQIVVNLVVNAVKFTKPDGRVSIAVEHTKDGGVSLTVSDTGIGIPAEDLANVTRPFFKAANALAPANPGIGLGLAITAELVRLHDGTLSIESAVGAGTTVTCRFPASRTAPGSQA